MPDPEPFSFVSRVPRPRLAARSFYDRLSGWYDLLASSETRFNNMGLRLLALSPGESVLEIGSGTGASLQAVARLVKPGGLAAGIELSFGMLAAAQRRFRKDPAGSNVCIHLGDAVALPYPPGYFQAVFSAFTLELFDTPEIPLVLAECRRVMVPGGRICVVSLSQPDRPGRMVRLYEWFHRVFPVVIDCRPIPAGLFLQQAGFGIRQSLCKSMWGLPVEIVLAEK